MRRVPVLLAAVVALALPPSAQGDAATALISGLPGNVAPVPGQFGWNRSGAYGDGSEQADADGGKVVFVSDADDLAPGAAERGPLQIYVKDTLSGALTDVTAGANGSSRGPTISNDGTKVAFVSRATNLAAADTTPDADAFVKDLTTGTVTLVSSPSAEDCDLGCASAAISGNGLYVVFTSPARLLPLVDPNPNGSDVYRRELSTSNLQLESARNGLTTATAGTGSSYTPSISNDGSIVAFRSTADDLVTGDTNGDQDVFVHKAGTTTTIAASAKSAGTALGDGDASEPHLSGDGTTVTYSSAATNISIGTEDMDPTPDVYRRLVSSSGTLTTAGTNVLISRATGASGAKGNGYSTARAISDNGTRVAFTSQSTNLGGAGYYAPYVREASTTTPLGGTGAQSSSEPVAISGNGATVVITAGEPLNGGDPPDSVYTRPAAGGAAQVVSARAGAAPAQPQLISAGYEYYDGDVQVVAAGGRYVVFSSPSPALTGSAEGGSQVFRRDRWTGDLLRISKTAAGAAATGGSPSISEDGARVAFVSSDALVPEDADDKSDAYVADVATGSLILASRGGSPDQKADDYVDHAQISADGTHVLFRTAATNLGDAGGLKHAYVRDLAAGTTRIADRADGAAGVVADTAVEGSTVSGDGTRVAFATGADNLGDGDADAQEDIHVRDLAAGTTTLASRADGAAGAKADSLSVVPVISRDGTKVAFRSYAKNIDPSAPLLVGSDIQAYLRDLGANTTRLVSRVGKDGAVSVDNGVETLSLSADGGTVAYQVNVLDDTPSNVAPDAPLGSSAIVVRDVASGSQKVVAIAGKPDPTDFGTAVGAASSSLSADGHCIAFSARGYGIVDGVSPDYREWFERALDGDCNATAPVSPTPSPTATVTATVTATPPVAPALSAVSLSRARFRVAARRTAVAARKRKRARAGTTVHYKLNVAATVTFTIVRKAAGRRSGKRCVAPSRRLRKHRRCTRKVAGGKLTRAGTTAGARTLAFSGRVGRRKLKRGRYAITLRAVGATGLKSKRVTKAFRIVRR